MAGEDDTSAKELEEWTVKLPEDKEAQLGCLTEPASKQQQEETFKQQLLAHLVDSIPLVLNTPDVKHVGVNMYVDDKGTAKALPTNVRASAIAQACGKMLEVKGDAFIGRVFDNDDDFVRMDFRLSEVSGDAPWVQAAKVQSTAAAAGDGGAAAGAALARAKAPGKMMMPGSIQRICGADRCSKNGTLRCSRLSESRLEAAQGGCKK
ncbi:hypothetical protein GQ600_6375 [Phytophthora cactorum]|nr:hypothetical protein GQ600_6375 [Phytophthora cactorum]